MQHGHTIKTLRVLATVLSLAASTAWGYNDPPAPQVTTVSSASFQALVSPDSLGTIMSPGLATFSATTSPGTDGKYPTEVQGISVEIANHSVPLLLVAPSQINFWIPADVPLGLADVRVKSNGAIRSGQVLVAKIAPAIFMIDCLNDHAAAATNFVTQRLEPFSVVTTESSSADKRTRLAIYGTGWRGISSLPKIMAIDAKGIHHELIADSSGAFNDIGIDRIDLTLIPEMEGLGMLKVTVEADGGTSNEVTINIGDTRIINALAKPYMVTTVAGSGVAGQEGDSAAAIHASLMTPYAVALDKYGALYIADTAANMVRKVSAVGIITRIAGTGVAGFNGDFQLAVNAQLSGPTGVAVNANGDAFIADRDNHRIRKVDGNGIITTLVGTGAAGSFGDLGAAIYAQLSSPSSVILDSFDNVWIADTGNHRIRRVTSDGRIATVVGTGVAGFSGDGGDALKAQLDSPTSLVATAQGVLFLADGKNLRVRRVAPDGTIQTIIGSGDDGRQQYACPALNAKFKFPIYIAADPLGQLLVSDSSAHEVVRMTSDCQITPIAGVTDEGFSGDKGLAVDAQFSQPHGMVSNPLGEVFLADTGNHRIRLLRPASANCSTAAVVIFSPHEAVSGQKVIGIVSLDCVSSTDTIVNLSADLSLPGLPGSVTIPAGSTSTSFEITLPPVVKLTIVTVLVNGNPGGTVIVIPASTTPHGSPTVTLTIAPQTVVGGQPVVGTLTLGAPAQTGGVFATFGADSPAASIVGQTTISEGATSLQVLIATSPVREKTIVQLTATVLGVQANAMLTILADPSQPILSLSLASNSATSGDVVQGVVSLTAPAPPTGQIVTLSSDNPVANVPNQLFIQGGSTKGTFDVQVGSSATAQTATVTATGPNEAHATLAVLAAANPSTSGTIGSFTIQPNAVVGGDATTGTVTLTAPAGNAGVIVQLVSNNPAVVVPPTVTVAVGSTSATVPVTTISVADHVTVTVQAISANTVQTSLSLDPKLPSLGQLSSLAVDPSSVVGGSQNPVGTVTLAAVAGTGGVTVNLSSNNIAATVPAKIVVLQGQSTGTFSISTSLVNALANVTVTATSANSTTAGLTLNPLEAVAATLSSLALTPNSLIGGQENASGTVTLASAAPAGGALVHLASNSLFAGVPATIVIPQGQTTGTFAVTTSLVSALQVASITATSANSTSAALMLNIPRTGLGMLSALSVSPSALIGGQQNANGIVTLAAPAPAGGILVTLSSNHLSATVPPSLIIPQGQTTGSFPVSTSLVATVQLVTITATSSNTATAGLTLNIVLPSTAAISSLSIAPSSVTGGLQGATGTVTLAAAAPAGGVTVTLSSDNSAAVVVPALLIPQGQTTGTFAVATLPVLSTQNVTVMATSANSTSAALTITTVLPGAGTISGISLNPSAVTGGLQGSTGTVTLASAAPAGGVLVMLLSNNLAAVVPLSIVIPQGQSSGTFAVVTLTVLSTQNVTITATSTNSTSAALAVNTVLPGTGTISGLSINPLTVTGGLQSATGTVTLASAAPAGGISVTLLSNNLAALVPLSIIIPHGQTTGTFAVTTLPVLSTQNVTLTATSANSVTAQLSITAPIAGSGTISGLTISPSSVTAGQQYATGSVTLASPAPAGGVLVTLTSTHLAALVPLTVTIPAGSTSGTFTVSTLPVLLVENATIRATSTNTITAGLTLNPAIGISSVSVSPNVVVGGSPATGTVTIATAAPTGGSIVTLSSDNAAASLPASVTIATGQTSATFPVTTIPVAGQQTAGITAKVGSSHSSTQLIVQQPCVNGLTLNVNTLLGGSGTTGIVALTGPAPAGGTTVTLVSANGAIQLPSSIFVPAGQTSATFNLTTSPVAVILSSTIQALLGNCGGIKVDVTVNAPILGSLGFDSNQIHLLGSVMGTVALNGPAPAGGVIVTLETGATLLGLLTIHMPTSVTIAPGQTSATFKINALGILLNSLNLTINATSILGSPSAVLSVVP